MDTIQIIFEKEFEKAIASAKTEAELEAIADSVSVKVEEILTNLSCSILQEIKRTAFSGGLDNHRKLHQEFVERNIGRWQEGFDIVELLIEVCTEAGSLVNDRLRSEAVDQQDLVFDVLVRLHAKACLISQEIVCLLKNGFADGAHARWRTLHEVTVTAMFLAKNGAEVVERYCLHEFVDSYKGACQYSKYAGRLQEDPLGDEDFYLLEEKYNQVLERFGADFKNAYGWAESALGKKRANFSDLEEAVSLDHLRPYYKWASQNIHANVKTIRFSLGLNETKEDILLAGPSNSGMVNPADVLAISLAQVTMTLLGRSPNLDDAVVMKMIDALSHEVGKIFVRCSNYVASRDFDKEDAINNVEL